MRLLMGSAELGSAELARWRKDIKGVPERFSGNRKRDLPY
jgi:hypothetical protein